MKDKQTDRQTEIKTETETEKERQRDRERERQRESESESETECAACAGKTVENMDSQTIRTQKHETKYVGKDSSDKRWERVRKDKQTGRHTSQTHNSGTDRRIVSQSVIKSVSHSDRQTDRTSKRGLLRLTCTFEKHQGP